MTRGELIDLAQAVVDGQPDFSKRGLRFGVFVTDAHGTWIGVASNTDPADCDRLLHAAAHGEGRVYRRRGGRRA